MKLNWGPWGYGLAAGFIGGGATAALGVFAAIGVTPYSYNFNNQLSNTLKLVIATFLVNGIALALAFLAKSPLPPIEQTTVSQTKTLDIPGSEPIVQKTVTDITKEVKQ